MICWPRVMVSAPLLPTIVVMLPEPDIFMVLPFVFSAFIVAMLALSFRLICVVPVPAFSVPSLALLPATVISSVLELPLRVMLSPLAFRVKVFLSVAPVPAEPSSIDKVLVPSVTPFSMVRLALPPSPIFKFVRLAMFAPLFRSSVLAPLLKSSEVAEMVPPLFTVMLSSPEPASKPAILTLLSTSILCVPVPVVISLVMVASVVVVFFSLISLPD